MNTVNFIWKINQSQDTAHWFKVLWWHPNGYINNSILSTAGLMNKKCYTRDQVENLVSNVSEGTLYQLRPHKCLYIDLCIHTTICRTNLIQQQQQAKMYCIQYDDKIHYLEYDNNERHMLVYKVLLPMYRNMTTDKRTSAETYMSCLCQRQLPKHRMTHWMTRQWQTLLAVIFSEEPFIKTYGTC